MNKIGDNIRLLRKRMGLTQIDFSKQIGISQGTLSDIEQGHCNPSVETVLSIHEQYGVSLDLILKGSEEDQSAKLHLKDKRNDEEELIEIIKMLSPEALSDLLDYATYKQKRFIKINEAQGDCDR
ncbi:helix-turn-helix domain-containing protein [Paenibacillus sp. LMG 31459]|uniref:Helix-turn-helix domain-containing protein n=1 Tax=Paenibacillus phytohabitans TaxID=2654978 RepID=A0ABX1YRL7_9BACL|nr:helix-turn-helix transcriptional regulator [Paenibacillus phytohabitans]NOU82944.1 helix-turn-helix domain-containing protein [Paenibacillus phytohabitans]